MRKVVKPGDKPTAEAFNWEARQAAREVHERPEELEEPYRTEEEILGALHKCT